MQKSRSLKPAFQTKHSIRSLPKKCHLWQLVVTSLPYAQHMKALQKIVAPFVIISVALAVFIASVNRL